MPAGGRGAASPACARTKAPVPSVTFAAPGSQQRRPNSDACWSPAAARTGTPRDRGVDRVRVHDRRQQRAAGRRTARAARRPSPARRAGTAASGPALPASVTWTPAEAVQEPGGDVAVGQARPGRGAGAVDVVEHPAQLRRRERRVELEPGALADERLVAVRAQLGARAVGPPVLPDDRRVDGAARRALPDHERLRLVGDAERRHVAGPAPAAASAPAIARSADSAIASGSCSTSPGPGNDEATATDARRRARAARRPAPRSACSRCPGRARGRARSPPHRGVARARRAPRGRRRARARRPRSASAARAAATRARQASASRAGAVGRPSRARRPSAPPRARPRRARGRAR